VYRPHNGTRFGNTEPYKTFAGAVAERPVGVGAFVQVSARGILVGTGIPMPARDQLPKLRRAIAETGTGLTFELAVAKTQASGAKVFGGRYDPLVRVLPGFPKDHPRGQYLRWKGVEASQRHERPTWRTSVAGATEIERLITAADPLHRWLARHVGPSSLTPEERFAPKSRT
jgi:uncharacterized protein (DUF2461 family)